MLLDILINQLISFHFKNLNLNRNDQKVLNDKGVKCEIVSSVALLTFISMLSLAREQQYLTTMRKWPIDTALAQEKCRTGT